MVETELRRHGGQVEFIVRTELPLYQDLLLKMGWARTAESISFARRLDASPDIDRIFERFSSQIETMIRQIGRLEPTDWEIGLETWVNRVGSSGLQWWLYGSGGCTAVVVVRRWWLYGSGALAVRGLGIQPGDLDLHVDDIDRAGGLISDLLVEPVTRTTGWLADGAGRAGDVLEATGPTYDDLRYVREPNESVRPRGPGAATS